ncbi:MAG: hypothetical protein ACKVP7_09320 [Hyphomicrobiaceae bacterium]
MNAPTPKTKGAAVNQKSVIMERASAIMLLLAGLLVLAIGRRR